MKREFLQLAQVYKPGRDVLAGKWFSWKLDGMRAFWDGGMSRGVPKASVPWANTAKDSRYKVPPVATGLWSRYGNVIHAPSWWLDSLPPIMLDGELWGSKLSRQQIMSTVKKLHPDESWKQISFYCYDMPPAAVIFESGMIGNIYIDINNIYKWAMDHGFILNDYITTFRKTYDKLGDLSGIARRLKQIPLPFSSGEAEQILNGNLVMLPWNVDGIIVRNPDAFYSACRSPSVLKVKTFDDAEGDIVGYVAGHGKLRGLMGAMKIRWKGIVFEISGFTDEERRPFDETSANWIYRNPGLEFPDWVGLKHFVRGSFVTFKYRGLSDTGVPQEARYWRKK